MSKEVKKGDSPGPPKTPGDDQQTPSGASDVARQEALAEEIMREDHEVLKELAKQVRGE